MKHHRTRGWRAVALVAIAGMAAIATVTPAGAQTSVVPVVNPALSLAMR